MILLSMLEGRVALFTDGTPHVLTVPRLFVEGIMTTEDYYLRPYYASFLRLIRYFAVFISIYLPGAFVALQLYHQEMIPTVLLISIAGARSGVPLPVTVETLLMILALEISRLGETVVPIIFTVIFISLILGSKSYRFSELLPVISDSTFRETNIGAIDIGIRFTDIIILTMLVPKLKMKENLNKVFFKSLIYSIVTGMLMLVAIQMALGIEFAKHINFPFLTFTRLIMVGKDIQGFDSLYIISWIMGNAVKISGYLYFTTIALAQVTNKKNQQFIIPVALVVLLTVLFIKDRRAILAVRGPVRRIVSASAFLTVLIIPSIVFLVYLFRKKSL